MLSFERLISTAEFDTWSTPERSSKITQKTHRDTVVCCLVPGQTIGLCISCVPQKLIISHHYRLSPRQRPMGRRHAYKEIGMKCLYCQGTMERGTAPFHIDRKGYHLILDTIPALVCRSAGKRILKRQQSRRSSKSSTLSTSTQRAWCFLSKGCWGKRQRWGPRIAESGDKDQLPCPKPGRTTACSRRPTAYAALRLSGAAEAQR